uniref:AH domain-containing protein n=1 Tax=Electrophorus electricus TaxID=8005 RepID=A0AAY5EBR9_ELEEL
MARVQKKFWKTKQVLIKATGKKEDEHVVASDADLDAKLEFFRSIQTTCTELLKVIEKYQQRITRLSQEENELGLFLRFQAEQDRTKAGSMMEATSKALCSSAKQRLALCPPLQRLEQEVETFRRRAIADTLLTVGRMEKARTEYRGALLWMKDVSQELDPDTYKQLEKFRKVQAQVRGTKVHFDKLKNDVCQKVDMLGASRCNMLSHSLCAYQVPHFSIFIFISLSFSPPQMPLSSYSNVYNTLFKFYTIWQTRFSKAANLFISSFLEMVVVLYDELKALTRTHTHTHTLTHSLSLSLSLHPPAGRDLLSGFALPAVLEEEEVEGADLSFLQDLLSPGTGGGSDGFSRVWQDAFGSFEAPALPPSTAQTLAPCNLSDNCTPSQPPSLTGFLPSQLLDQNLSSTGISLTLARTHADMSAWFNLFADLDPLSNPDAIGRSNDELLNA